MAAGRSAGFFTSSNGIDWKYQYSRVASEIQSLAWSGSRLAAAGYHGAILTGTPATIAIRKSPRRESLAYRLLPHGLSVSLPGYASGTNGLLDPEGAVRASLSALNGTPVRAPESITGREIRFSTLGLAAGVYILRAEWAGRTYARAVTVEPWR